MEDEQWYPPVIKDKVEKEQWRRLKYDSDYPFYAVFINKFGEKLVYDVYNDGICMQIAPSWVFNIVSEEMKSGHDYNEATQIAIKAFQKFKTDILFKEMVDHNRLYEIFGDKRY